MKIAQRILFLFIFFTTGISAQVVYDTIPDESDSLQIIGSFTILSFPYFKNIDLQINNYLNNTDFQNPNYQSGTVVVSTIFGKSGKQKGTKILKPLNPYCDSIAFYAISGLKDWLPARKRAHYVDYEYQFPIHFPVNQEDFNLNLSWLNSTPSEYQSEKRKYNFYTSTAENEKLPANFNYLTDFIADELNDSTYIHLTEWTKPNKRDRIKVEITNESSGRASFLIRDPEKNWLLFHLSVKKKFYLEKGKKYQIIGFKPLNKVQSILSIDTISVENDTLFTPEYRYTTKVELLKKINSF